MVLLRMVRVQKVMTMAFVHLLPKEPEGFHLVPVTCGQDTLMTF
jgi:hypothetical protein